MQLTLEELIFLELFLDVLELCGLADVDTGLSLPQLAYVDVPILLVPLPLQQLTPHGYRSVHLQSIITNKSSLFTLLVFL